VVFHASLEILPAFVARVGGSPCRVGQQKLGKQHQHNDNRSHTASFSSVLRRRYFVERGAQPARELQRIIYGPEVHENQARLLGEHVAVNRRDLDGVAAQLPSSLAAVVT
jgi:hypothetical protein